MIGKIKAFTYKYRYPLILAFIAIISHAQWFNPASILQSGDWQFRFDEHVRQLLDGWGSWIGFSDFGTPNIQLFAYPLRGIVWDVLATIGFSYDMITKLTLFMPLALGSFLIPYFVARRLISSRPVALTGALFYATTTYILIMETRHLLIGIVYILAPLLFYCTHLLRTRNRSIDWTVAALIFTTAIVYELRIMYIIFCLMALYFLYEWIFGDIRSLRPYLKPFLLWGGLMLLLNAFWILPTLLGAGGTISATADRGLFGNDLFTLPQSFTIFRWSWTGGYENRAFIIQPIQWYLWLVPIVAFSMLAIKNRFRKELLFFGIVAIIGLLLTKQSSPPFSGLYLWLYTNIPGFDLFREASKFYVITAFAYWGLLIYGLRALSKSSVHKHRLAYIAASFLVIGVALVNLKPLVTREIGAVFVSSKVPQDYVILKDFLVKQKTYSRTLWVPLTSPWGYYDNTHPKMGVLTYTGKDWETLALQDKALPATDQLPLGPLKSSLSDMLLDSGSVQYVIVPNRNLFNYDDQFIAYGGKDNADVRANYLRELDKLSYLKRKDIGTKELVVYENQNYEPYVNSPAQVFAFDKLDSVHDSYASLGQALGTGFHFAEGLPKGLPSRSIKNIFTDLQESVNKQALTQTVDVAQPSTFIAAQDPQDISYSIADGQLSFSQSLPSAITSDDGLRTVTIAKTTDKELLASVDFDPSAAYYLHADNRLVPLDTALGEHQTGEAKNNLRLLRQEGGNLLPNANVDKEPWGAKDCNPEDADPFAQPGIATDPDNPSQKYMVLTARKHVSCVAQEHIPIKGNTAYRFSLDYRVLHGNYGGYSLVFNTKDGNTVREYLPIGESTDWRRSDTLVTAPAGATDVTVTLYGYSPVRLLDYTSTAYDNISLIQLQPVIDVPVAKTDSASIPLKNTGKYAVTYSDGNLNTSNRIPNPSFENNLWKNKVSDCNEGAGGTADIAMSTTSQASNSKQALELRARRHIACTSTAAPVEQNRGHLLQFDYKSPSGDPAGYYVAFDDPARTTIQGKITSTSGEWQTFAKHLQVPNGAHSMALTVYSYGNETRSNYAINQYDNFLMAAVPDLSARYYIVSDPSKTSQPKDLQYTATSATAKTATVKGVTAPFYLKMNEAYHPKWQLTATHAGKSFTVAKDTHFKIDNTVNGWYIDPAKICHNQAACTKNKDGSYDMNLAITYTPQKWFHIGLAISTLTLGCCTWFIGRYWYKRRNTKPAA